MQFIQRLVDVLFRTRQKDPQAEIVLPKSCAKCGRPVAYGNSVRMFDALYYNCPGILMLRGDWHLLPVIENGEQVCEGSPSRFQYFDGYPRDARGKTTYKPYKEIGKRAAFAKMRPGSQEG